MKKFGIGIVVAIVAVAFVFCAPVLATDKPAAAPAAAPAKAEKAPAVKKADSVTVNGVITEGTKDKKTGKIKFVNIQTDKDVYVVSGKSKGTAELMKMVGKKVEATGQIKEKKDKKYITVTSYKVVE